MSGILEIDGSFFEGGGQILRNALSLSCIFRRPVRVINIRANRTNPGLSNQHVYDINLLQEITSARVSGNFAKSMEVEFYPGNIKCGHYVVDTRTAASVSLVLQAALPVLIFANGTSTLEITGGTNVGMAPQVDYMTEVFRPNLECFGVTFDFDLVHRGYYPRGRGIVKVKVPAVSSIRAVNMTSLGEIAQIEGWCFVAGSLPVQLAENMKKAADKELREQLPSTKKRCIDAYKENRSVAKDNGAGIVLKAVTTNGCILGASALGGRQFSAHDMGASSANELMDYIKSGTCVDRYVQDQLILFMALAVGTSRIRTCTLTNHTLTAIHVAEQMTGVKFHVEIIDIGINIISCDGIGYCMNT